MVAGAVGNENVTVYSDDINIIISAEKEKSLEANLSKVCSIVKKWADEVGMKINVKKSKILPIYRRSNSPLKIQIGAECISQTPSLKVLGVIFDEGLKCKSHLEKLHDDIVKRTRALISLTGQNWGPQLQIR